MRIRDWVSDVCSSDLYRGTAQGALIQAISGENLMFDLTGMTALVTGASGGIGSAIAQALAAQGARLAVSGSNADKLNAVDRKSVGTGERVAEGADVGGGCLNKTKNIRTKYSLY